MKRKWQDVTEKRYKRRKIKYDKALKQYFEAIHERDAAEVHFSFAKQHHRFWGRLPYLERDYDLAQCDLNQKEHTLQKITYWALIRAQTYQEDCMVEYFIDPPKNGCVGCGKGFDKFAPASILCFACDKRRGEFKKKHIRWHATLRCLFRTKKIPIVLGNIIFEFI